MNPDAIDLLVAAFCRLGILILLLKSTWSAYRVPEQGALAPLKRGGALLASLLYLLGLAWLLLEHLERGAQHPALVYAGLVVSALLLVLHLGMLPLGTSSTRIAWNFVLFLASASLLFMAQRADRDFFEQLFLGARRWPRLEREAALLSALFAVSWSILWRLRRAAWFKERFAAQDPSQKMLWAFRAWPWVSVGMTLGLSVFMIRRFILQQKAMEQALGVVHDPELQDKIIQAAYRVFLSPPWLSLGILGFALALIQPYSSFRQACKELVFIGLGYALALRASVFVVIQSYLAFK